MHAFFCPGKENDSQAHKRTSAQAHKLTTAREYVFVVMSLLALTLPGCGAITDASDKSVVDFPTNDFSHAPAQSVIDAGIVFANEASYLCVPLRRLGIADSDEVITVQSSCDCSLPSIIQFDESPIKTARALRIDFIPEPATASSKRATSNLSVEVTLRLREGRTKVTTIRFVHIVLAQGAES